MKMIAKHIFLQILLAASLCISSMGVTLAQEQSSEPGVSEDVENLNEEQDASPSNNPDQEAADSQEAINDLEPPKVSYDLEALPFPTRRMRELLLEATQNGDIEKLRQLIGIGENATQLSFGGTDGDPIEFLKQESGDSEGHEILAILSEVLEAGYVHLDVGTENELYVWPYFFALSLDDLTPIQKVELFRLVTYGDFQDMQEFGGYIFYRVGISPTGRWEFFVAGD